MTKKILFNSFLFLSLLLQQSCLTKAIWGDKHYNERIEKFLIGEDGRYVVFVGSEYHYVFTDNSGLLKTIISLKQKDVLTINTQKTHLKLESNNDIKGYLVLHGPFEILPPEDVVVLESWGFRADKNDDVSIKIKLTGRRYAARYLGNLQGSSVMDTRYTIPIYYNDSGFVKGIGKAAITPVAVGLDAVLLIGKIVVAPFKL